MHRTQPLCIPCARVAHLSPSVLPRSSPSVEVHASNLNTTPPSSFAALPGLFVGMQWKACVGRLGEGARRLAGQVFVLVLGALRVHVVHGRRQVRVSAISLATSGRVVESLSRHWKPPSVDVVHGRRQTRASAILPAIDGCVGRQMGERMKGDHAGRCMAHVDHCERLGERRGGSRQVQTCPGGSWPFRAARGDRRRRWPLLVTPEVAVAGHT